MVSTSLKKGLIEVPPLPTCGPVARSLGPVVWGHSGSTVAVEGFKGFTRLLFCCGVGTRFADVKSRVPQESDVSTWPITWKAFHMFNSTATWLRAKDLTASFGC